MLDIPNHSGLDLDAGMDANEGAHAEVEGHRKASLWPDSGTFGRNGKKEKLMIVQGGKWLQEKSAG